MYTDLNNLNAFMIMIYDALSSSRLPGEDVNIVVDPCEFDEFTIADVQRSFANANKSSGFVMHIKKIKEDENKNMC